MATLQTWVDRTRSHLMSGRGEERNTLAAPYVAASGSLQMTNALGGIVVGSRLSIGQNTFYVAAVSATTSTVTVLGGQEGTTDANAASGSLVRVNPRFTDFDIVDALTTDLADLSAPDNGLFAMTAVDFTLASAQDGYALLTLAETKIIDAYELRVTDDDPLVDLRWRQLPKAFWRLDRNGQESLPATSTAVLRLLTPSTSGAVGSRLRLLVRTAFDAPPTLATDLNTTGLAVSAYDIPPMGAAMRLISTREVKRNFTETQGDTRRAGEVNAGAVAQSMRPLAVMRQARIQSEAARLSAKYPDRRW